MKIPYFCCIGAELKRYAQDFDFMNQVYLYKVPTGDTIEEVFAQDYFQAVATTVLQDDILYIYEPTTRVLYTCRFNKQNGHITAEQMSNDTPALTPNKLLKSDENGKVAASDFSENDFVKKSGDTMSGPLKMRATSSFQCAIAPYWDGVGFYKLNSDDSMTLIASIETPDGFVPWVTNTYNIGSSLKKWKNLYLAGKAYISTINNGYDIAVPVTNSADTFALKSQVDLAANSGDQLTEKGVWYAKMYSATVAPSAEDGTNYADFSQTDGQGNPIIVIYKRQNGAWVQDQTITPPAEYNGYVPVTSKIWDIVEQAGQQGGKVLWSHSQKTFTPSPLIISFKDIEVTGNSTVIMPQNPGTNQIVNKNYVDEAIAGADYVVESQFPTAENNYTWYRKYKSGWVEQGGRSDGHSGTITLPVEMADTNYTLICSGMYATRTNTSPATWSGVSGNPKSTTQIELGEAGGFAVMGWQVSGMAAS